MEIKMHGNQDAKEAMESVSSVLRLFKDRYGIGRFSEIHMHVTLLNDAGEEVELVDADTSEVLGIFELYKSGAAAQLPRRQRQSRPGKMLVKRHLSLVVDNTRKRS